MSTSERGLFIRRSPQRSGPRAAEHRTGPAGGGGAIRQVAGGTNDRVHRMQRVRAQAAADDGVVEDEVAGGGLVLGVEHAQAPDAVGVEDRAEHDDAAGRRAGPASTPRAAP